MSAASRRSGTPVRRISTANKAKVKSTSARMYTAKLSTINMPVKIGVAGVAEIPKLISISARIGVKDASKFILKNARFVGALLRSGGIYRPTQLVEQLAPLIADPSADILGFHVYTFNNVAATVEWRDLSRAGLGG